MLVFNIKKMFKIILYCVKLEQFGCQLPSHYWPGSELRPVQYSDKGLIVGRMANVKVLNSFINTVDV